MTNDEVRIWRHGKLPDDKTLYFICRKCGCIYSTSQKNCEFEDDHCTAYYAYDCPECGCRNGGMNERDYKRRMGLKA